MCHVISLIRFILKDVLNRWYIYIYIAWFTALRGLWLPISVHKSNTYHAGLSPVIYPRSVNVSKHVLKVCRTFTGICPLPLFKSDKANKLLNVAIYTK